MDWIFTPDGWIAFLTLTALEIVLGVDNIIFIAILSEKLPGAHAAKARVTGLVAAMVTRILLLLSLSYIMRLTKPLFTVMQQEISGQDIVLIVGGLFLLAKSALEIHGKLEGHDVEEMQASPAGKFVGVIVQIMLLDIVFSLDSVITAVGMVNDLGIMISAIVVAVAFMLIFVNALNRFLENRPTLKILALSFLLLVGVALIAEGFDTHIPRGYIYFAMAFSTFVEMINIRIRRKTQNA